jgi:hypothetical protein
VDLCGFLWISVDFCGFSVDFCGFSVDSLWMRSCFEPWFVYVFAYFFCLLLTPTDETFQCVSMLGASADFCGRGSFGRFRCHFGGCFWRHFGDCFVGRGKGRA